MAEVLVNFANLFLRVLSRSAVHVPIQQALLIFGTLHSIELGLIVAFTLGLTGSIHQAGKIILLQLNDSSFEVASWFEKTSRTTRQTTPPLITNVLAPVDCYIHINRNSLGIFAFVSEVKRR